MQRKRKSKSKRANDVQTELDELQMEYRKMEGSRKMSNEDSQNTIRMQRQQILKLKKDNDRLKEDLALETRQAKQANNMSASAQIAKLQEEGEMYARKIAMENGRVKNLNSEIARMERTILEQRRTMGGINASRDNNLQVQKKIRQLENRLDKALVKFNEALAHNKSLRETIDNLRRERVVFDGIYKKLEKELHEKKNKMADIISKSNKAYKERDAAQQEMIALKVQADKEQANFEAEWRKLGKLISNDVDMKSLINLEESRDSLSGKAAEEALNAEKKMKSKVKNGAAAIAKDRAAITLAKEKVAEYEEAFRQIQQRTNISDINELVNTFIHAEDQNFTLFNYVNDLSSQIEQLDGQTKKIKLEIEKYKGVGQSSDNQRKAILKELKNKLQRTSKKSEMYEQSYESALKTVATLKHGIKEIFDQIGCNSHPSAKMLGTTGVTESNMMQYLGIIEAKTNELLQTYQQQQGKITGLGGLGNNNMEDMKVAPPQQINLGGNLGEDQEDEDDMDELPMSAEEMKLQQQQAAREQAAGMED